jgi:tyrosyl-tRNA synthetase
MEKFTITQSDFTEGIGVLDFLATNTQIFASKGEARKMIQAGAVQINKQKINESGNLPVRPLREKWLLVQKGKKNYFLLEIR